MSDVPNVFLIDAVRPNLGRKPRGRFRPDAGYWE